MSEFKVGDKLFWSDGHRAELRTVAKVHKGYFVDSRNDKWNTPHLNRRGGAMFERGSVWSFDPNNEWQSGELRKTEIKRLREAVIARTYNSNNEAALRSALEALGGKP